MRKPLDRALINKALGQTIATLRKQHGIVQEKLAAQAGVERAHMSGIERGEHSPVFATIYRLLPVLGVNLIDFSVAFEHTLRRLRRNKKTEPPAEPKA